MKHSLPAAFLLSLSLATLSIAADKKPKPPTGTPSTLPPTSPMLAVPQPDAASKDDKQSGKLISSEMNGRDLGFFMKTVEAGREQAFFVDLLKKSASSDRIKSLADTLAAAQTEENTHIAKLAAQKGLNVSLEPTAAEKKVAEELARLSGSNFDKAALDKVVAANNEALAAYQAAAQSTDPQIKSFAAQMLPLAEEKRHIVEKMTGAGSKAANQLFRHGGVSEGMPVATPAATPAGKGTPALSLKSTPSILPMAAPTPPTALALPVATPPGQGAPAPMLPPIVPPKAPPTPVPVR
jgi:predicted outer membrane protein